MAGQMQFCGNIQGEAALLTAEEEMRYIKKTIL